MFLISDNIERQSGVEPEQDADDKVSICGFCVCKKFFKWYHFMVRCKSYAPLSDEW